MKPKPQTILFYLVVTHLALSLLTASCITQKSKLISTPSSAGLVREAALVEDGKILAEAWTKIRKHYVDEPNVGDLASAAIAGMEYLLDSKNHPFTKVALDQSKIGEDEIKAFQAIGFAFGNLRKTPGVQSTPLEYAAIQGMMKALDPACTFLTPELYKELSGEVKSPGAGIGLQVGFRDKRLTVIAPIEGTQAHRAGIKSGDYLVKIDDDPTQNLSLTEVVQRLRGPAGSKITVTVERKGAPELLSFELIREVIRIESVQAKVIEEMIGYVRLKQFRESTTKDLKKVLSAFHDQNIQALILDLRGNPGGLLTTSVEVVEQFLERNKLIIFLSGRDGRRDEYVSRNDGDWVMIPMAALVNHGSAGGAEIVAGALQDHGRAVIIGTETFGRGTVQTILPLTDGSALRMTTARYYRPSGKAIELAKILPDLVVEDEPETDRPLFTAVALLKAFLRQHGQMKT